jgi:hypothetical protein
MYQHRMKLNLDKGLGRLLASQRGNGEEMITPQRFRRDALAALGLLERQNWIVPTRGEILASSDDQPAVQFDPAR